MAPSEQVPPQQAVRFSSVNQEIDPVTSLQQDQTAASHFPEQSKDDISLEDQEAIRSLPITLQKSRCQAKRMENFSFEPVSLPASRAPSPSSAHRTPSTQSSYRSGATPRPSPPASAMHSPPLTPAATISQDGKPSPGAEQRKIHADPAMMTPQVSPPHEPPPTSIGMRSSSGDISAPAASPRHSPKPTSRPQSISDISGIVSTHPKHTPKFTVGPAGDSLPPSRDISPSASPSSTPGQHTPGTSTPTYSRPFTPSGEIDDPYARAKRPPQNTRNLEALDARFIFGGRDSRKRESQNYSSSSSTAATPLPRSRGNAAEIAAKEEKRQSLFGGNKSQKDDSDNKSIQSTQNKHDKPHESMSNLKRFFKLGGHKHSKDKDSKKEKRSTPAPSIKSSRPAKPNRSGSNSPPSSHGSVSVPFADDHGLESKYGKFGKVLGSGAGGSVRLMKRSTDGVTFAVKQFRARHSYETEKEYSKKVTAEFCIGSTLHHGNIIETMDLVHEKGNWYVVMEYAPFDLFAIVMTGKMSRDEISCATLQILNGVTYLHSMGLAHRDLKLDNVVVNEHGIMKIIDFGSAAVFKYPFENDTVLATGIVGSDPYLAPEVYDLSRYDPQPTDIWSLAIIFCCMTLRRFPWKAPRLSDNSYKLFVSPPNDGPRSIQSKSTSDLNPTSADNRASVSEPASRQPSDGSTATHHHHHHHRNRSEKDGVHSDPVTNDPRASSISTASGVQAKEQPQVIKGPWRLLRLLPRESRHIVGRMLELDPKKRATMDEILEDKWVCESQICRQEEGGMIVRAEGHGHALEPGTGASAPPTKAS